MDRWNAHCTELSIVAIREVVCQNPSAVALFRFEEGYAEPALRQFVCRNQPSDPAAYHSNGLSCPLYVGQILSVGEESLPRKCALIQNADMIVRRVELFKSSSVSPPASLRRLEYTAA